MYIFFSTSINKLRVGEVILFFLTKNINLCDMSELIYLAICFIDAGKAIVIGPKVSIFIIIIIITFNHQVS